MSTTASPAGGRPPKPKMRNPEQFNESMYQKGLNFLMQKEQRVREQKREAQIKESEQCTFTPTV